jgi:glycerol-3-phosphate dehydrogenase
MINVFGGKITTYRRLSEATLEKIEALLGPKGRRWTAEASLPGGDFAATAFDEQVAAVKADFPFLQHVHARRLVRLYGTRARTILGDATSLDDLGRCFGADLYEAEVRYLVDMEWAQRAEDVLWRRTKRGLRLGVDEVAVLEEYMRGVTRRDSWQAAE